jgi:hypothetical protein
MLNGFSVVITDKQKEVLSWEFLHDLEISSVPISMPCWTRLKTRKN